MYSPLENNAFKNQIVSCQKNKKKQKKKQETVEQINISG